MYHLHVPLPDPMVNPDTVARASFYKVTGTPTFIVDGTNQHTGGGSRENADRPYGQLATMIDEALNAAPQARLSANATLAGHIVKVHANVTHDEPTRHDLKLRVALVERELRYGGENGIRFHPMVVRAVAELPIVASAGVDGSAETSLDTEFDVSHVDASLTRYLDGYEQRNDRFGPITFAEKLGTLDENNLGVVALIQADADRRVLQSLFINLGINQTSQ
jgi:hypothetical protein